VVPATCKDRQTGLGNIGLHQVPELPALGIRLLAWTDADDRPLPPDPTRTVWVQGHHWWHVSGLGKLWGHVGQPGHGSLGYVLSDAVRPSLTG
jgi:hypothetical protein